MKRAGRPSGVVLALIFVLLSASAELYARQNVRFRGRVLDSRTNEPIAKALVAIRERKIETTTNDLGEFEIADVQPGEVELYVTTVGYAVIRKKIDVTAGTPAEIEILLGPDVIRRSDEVTVTSEPFVSPIPSTLSDHTLNESELKNLTSVLIDDPLRSVQSLPGVTTGDDFTADFSARGAGFRSIGFNLDGVLVVSPAHAVSDINDGGSLSIFNGDVIESVTLLSSAFRQLRRSDRRRIDHSISRRKPSAICKQRIGQRIRTWLDKRRSTWKVTQGVMDFFGPQELSGLPDQQGQRRSVLHPICFWLL